MSAVFDDRSQGAPVTAGAAGVVECVEAFRAAMAAGDAEQVQAMRWLAPRPAGERDLLSDLAAAEGLAHAIHELSRFWKRAHVRLERVREVDTREAEVYERLELPTDSLPIVTILRRDRADAPWKIVCTNEAYDERCVLWLPMAVSTIDDAELAAVMPTGTELLMDGASGVLAHDAWLVHARGPQVPEAWPPALPGQTTHIFELAAALAADADDRRAQLRWLFGCARALLPALGGHAVYLKREQRVMMPQAIDAILGGEATPAQAVRFWTRIDHAEGFVYTDGLRLLGLPEIEAPETLFTHLAAVRALVDWLAERVIRAEQMVAPGTEVSIGERSLTVVGGRRGSRRGHSYGRCGAVRLVDSEGVMRRGSRSRMHAPDEIALRT